MSLTETTDRTTLVNVTAMIVDMQTRTTEWGASGKIKVGDKLSHLLYFEMTTDERAQFHEQLNGYPIPQTPYTLEWIPGFNYFEIALTSP